MYLGKTIVIRGSHPLDLIHAANYLMHATLDLIHAANYLMHATLDLIHAANYLMHAILDLIHAANYLMHATNYTNNLAITLTLHYRYRAHGK
jgi:hypothetical protein